jgi:hypothetical protein
VNRLQASTLLGVSENATPSESRKAYLTRARLLHPDRLVGGSTQDIAAANNAMAQLNEAYEVMQKPAAAEPTSSRPTDSEPADNFGFPVWSDAKHACELCGWGPAQKTKFNSTSGFIIFMRWYTFEAKVCKICARAMYDENQRSNLTKGWWGIFSFFATIYAFFSNMAALRGTRSLDAPVGRYPGAYTISPVPLVLSTKWFKRPSAIIASIIALGIVALIGIGAATPTNSSTAPSGTTNQQGGSGTVADPTVDGLRGTCIGEDSSGQLSKVSCDSSSATWIIKGVLSAKKFSSEDCRTDDVFTYGENQEYIVCVDSY